MNAERPLFFFDDATIFHDAFTVKTQEDPAAFVAMIQQAMDEADAALRSPPEFILFYHCQADLDNFVSHLFPGEVGRDGIRRLSFYGVEVQLRCRPDLTPKGEIFLMKTPRGFFDLKGGFSCPTSRW